MKSSRVFNDFYIISIWVDVCFYALCTFLSYMIHASYLNLLDSFQQKMEKKTSTFFHPSFATCCQGAKDDAATEAQASCVILKHMGKPTHFQQQIPERRTPEMLDTHPREVLMNGSTEAMNGSTETCNLLEVRYFSGEPFVKLLQFVLPLTAMLFAEVRSHQQHQKWVSNQVHVASGRHNRQTFCWCLLLRFYAFLHVPVFLSQVPGWKNAHEWSMTTTSCVGKMLVLHVETHCSNTTLSPPISADSISPFNTIRKHLNLTCMTHMTCITSKNCQQPWLSGVVGTSVFSLCASQVAKKNSSI